MLQLFRTNQLFTIILLLLYTFLVRLNIFIYPTEVSVTNVQLLSKMFLDIVGYDTVTNKVMACLLVFLQSILFNSIVQQFKMMRENTFFPAVAYIFISSFAPEFLVLSPLLLANTFLIVTIQQLLNIYKNPNATGNLFNIGFGIALSSLFYYGSGVFLLLGIIGLYRFRSFKLSELLILILGFLIPFFLFGVGQYWNDNLSYFWQHEIITPFALFDWNITLDNDSILILSIYGFLLLWSILISASLYQKTGIQTRKNIGLFYIAILVALLSTIYQRNVNIAHLQILSVPLAFFLAAGLLRIKNRAISEILHILLLILLLWLQYNQWIIQLLISE